MNEKPKPLPFDDLTFPTDDNPDAALEEWQKKKIRRGLKAADEGRFASPDRIKVIVAKFVPNG
ncbi:hypothetical protein [Rhizobium sp. SL42]|uniref:hypothetical protein n=1 Tax=Rhizobium sp. SL42 TaxID=2806346 RepID=UPI001F47B40B|nr:hypothetical protein [Rhizobium sp. SL42]UJW76350.1 hypothetical protein IM739_07675 [Rhizobium sp. SL42]